MHTQDSKASVPFVAAVEPPWPQYVSDAAKNTIIEKLSGGDLREFLLGCVRTQRILDELAKVSPSTPHPQIVRESVLHPDFVAALGDCLRNECRGDHTPRFLLLDLDSFRSFVVD